MLALAGVPDADVEAALRDGRAMDVWRRMVAAQGGDPDAPLPVASHTQDVLAERDGVLTRLDALAVGASRAGAWAPAAPARRTRSRLGAGIEIHAVPGERVHAGQKLLTLHTDTPERFERAAGVPDRRHRHRPRRGRRHRRARRASSSTGSADPAPRQSDARTAQDRLAIPAPSTPRTRLVPARVSAPLGLGADLARQSHPARRTMTDDHPQRGRPHGRPHPAQARVDPGAGRGARAEAADLGAYSICVSPSLLPVDVPEGVLVATVCGFPSGAHHSEVKAAEAARSVARRRGRGGHGHQPAARAGR